MFDSKSIKHIEPKYYNIYYSHNLDNYNSNINNMINTNLYLILCKTSKR